MKRAISPIVATILIITVTVALAGGLLIFIMNLQSRMTTSSAEAPTLYNLRINPGTVTCNYQAGNQLTLSFYGEAVGEEIPSDVQLILTITKSDGTNCFTKTAPQITIQDLFGGPISPGEFKSANIKINLTSHKVYLGTKEVGTWSTDCDPPTTDTATYVVTISTAKSAQPATFTFQAGGSSGNEVCKT